MMFSVLHCPVDANGAKIVLKESIKKLKYLKEKSIPRFTAMLENRSSFLLF
jgi:hypothetical protein